MTKSEILEIIDIERSYWEDVPDDYLGSFPRGVIVVAALSNVALSIARDVTSDQYRKQVDDRGKYALAEPVEILKLGAEP